MSEATTKSSGRAGAERAHELAGVPARGELIGGKFRIDHVLGVGGMGVVVSAEHIHLRQRVAVKFLRADVATEKTASARFLREAQAMSALRGSNIVRVLDVGRIDNGPPYMVMEYLEGRDLGAVAGERKTLPVSEAVDYILQACEGIAEAHAGGIIHRDIKPANLFLTHRPDGTALVKVLDFGVSKVIDPEAAQGLTDTAAILGSPAYMSPEQVRSSKSVDARTDIWALGVTLYRLVSGALPFDSDSDAGMCAVIVMLPPVALRTVLPHVPPAFEATVMRCLEKDMARRFQSVGELANALEPFASAAGKLTAAGVRRMSATILAPEAPAPTVALEQATNRRLPVLLIACAIVVALLFGTALVFSSRSERAPNVRAPAPSASASASVVAGAEPAAITPSTQPGTAMTTATPSVSTARTPAPAASTKAAAPASTDDLIQDRR
jgi:serine/threonine protein kinase